MLVINIAISYNIIHVPPLGSSLLVTFMLTEKTEMLCTQLTVGRPIIKTKDKLLVQLHFDILWFMYCLDCAFLDLELIFGTNLCNNNNLAWIQKLYSIGFWHKWYQGERFIYIFFLHYWGSYWHIFHRLPVWFVLYFKTVNLKCAWVYWNRVKGIGESS
jgi:hypothetical protein